MSSLKASHRLRAMAASIPLLKVPITHNPKVKTFIAAFTLVLFWIIGPHTFNNQAHGRVAPHEPALEASGGLMRNPFSHSRPTKEKDESRVPSDLFLSFADAEKFCFHHHLEPYNASAEAESHNGIPHDAPKRRIYDLLLVTPTTSPDLLELRLASLYQYVDYFMMLEVPPEPTTDSPAAGAEPTSPSSPETPEDPTLLDKIWSSRLTTYRSKIIRHTLSQHSHDFKTGLDHSATTRNALVTRVIPLLTGAQKVQLGDVLLVSDAEELVRPVTMKVLRNCHIPERTTIRTRKYWYSYQWMKIDGAGATPDGAQERPDGKKNTRGNEWWPHPQATIYRGADTTLPDDLRRQRAQDEYVFGDGGWTCHMCYATITETLGKMGEADFIWHDGPRWKAAGRVVDRVMNGIDLQDRTNLSRIESNPDLPPHLQGNAHRYKWLLDRDPLGANFADFEAGEHERYLAKKKAVDSEPDFERTQEDVEHNSKGAQEQDSSPQQSEDGPEPSWRNLPKNFIISTDGLSLSDEDRKFLEEIKGETSDLSQQEIAMLESLSSSSEGSTV